MKNLINKIICVSADKVRSICNVLINKYSPVVENSRNEYVAFENGMYKQIIDNMDVYSPTKSCLSLYNQIFNSEIYKFETLSTTPKIIDCGANIGLGILYWKSIFPESEIIAFEPSKKVFDSLRKNLKANGLTDVKIYNAAVSTHNGYSEFTFNEGVSGSLFLEKNLGDSYKVKTLRLDSFLTEQIDLLKVDIEGEEINILPQIVQNIDNIKNLFIEYHSFINQPQQLSKFLKHLEECGFRYYIEGEYKNKAPLINSHTKLNQDLQVSIWAKKL